MEWRGAFGFCGPVACVVVVLAIAVPVLGAIVRLIWWPLVKAAFGY